MSDAFEDAEADHPGHADTEHSRPAIRRGQRSGPPGAEPIEDDKASEPVAPYEEYESEPSAWTGE